MELAGCEALREVLGARRIILLTATEAEARPLRDALLQEASHTVATKSLYLGQIRRAPGPDTMVPVVVGVSGCDKANAAHLLTCLLQAMPLPPDLVLQVGIAGGFSEGGSAQAAAVGDVVIATSEAYSDTGSSSPAGWLSAAELGLPIACPADIELGGMFPLDLSLAEVARDVIVATESAAGGGAVGVLHARPAVLLGPCVTSSCATGLRGDAQAVARRWGALAESMEGAAAAQVSALYGIPFLEIRGISNLVTDRERGSWEVERAVEVAARAALAMVAALDRLPGGGK